MRRRLHMAQASGLVLAMACSPAWSQIFRCPNGDGFSFQQAPCPGLGASGGQLLVLPNGRRAPVAPPSAPAGSRTGRVLGRTPLPTPILVRTAK